MSIYDDLKPVGANHSPLTPLRFLRRAAAYFPDQIGLIHSGGKVTWRQIDERCRRFASALIRRGIGAGDTVSVLAPNGQAIFEAQFGVPMSGAVLNNLNVRIEPATLAFILKHCEAKILIVDAEYGALVRAALRNLEDPPLIVDVHDPEARDPMFIGELDYESLLSEGDPGFRPTQPLNELQPIVLNYTSGTTGNPKGVVYDHRNAFVESLGNLLSWAVTGQPRQLWAVPIFHANGWCYLWGLAGLGATNIMIRRPTGRGMLEAIASHHVTHICGAPIIAQMMAEVPAAERPHFDHPVRMLTAGAPPTPVNFVAMEALGIQLDQGYGLTEVWGPAIFREPRDAWNSLEPLARGRLKTRQGIPNLALDDVMVADPETLKPVPRDGTSMGEVMFRGNIIMRGYLKNPRATEEAFADGWFHSGDLAIWHPDGEIELKDRLKDIIISGGENISSIEIENVIAEHLAVSGAAVIGVSDEKWGETPWAFVELKSGIEADEADILRHCRDRLAGFKIPKGVTFGQIPKTVTGKVQKFMLRRLVQEGRS